MDPGLNSLLKWSVENSSATSTTTDPTTAPPASRIDPEALNVLFGGPSDADLMLSSMSAIRSTDPSISTADKAVAFDNFEQLIENLDNANNLKPLALWEPLLECLDHDEAVIRKMAAWCVGTAVQNNEKSQAMLVEVGGVQRLARLAVKEGEGRVVRRKAVYALSSACRNNQPAMDLLVKELVALGRVQGEVDASNMDACDVLIGRLREEANKAAE